LSGGTASCRPGVEPHSDAAQYRDRMGRAGVATARPLHGVDAGHLFNAEFKRRQIAASASGERFITFAVAMKRLRIALVPLLAGGKNRPPVGQSVFQSVFG
jgi:hypothetical protein